MNPSRKVHIPDEPLLSSTTQRLGFLGGRGRVRATGETKMESFSSEAFAIQFTKLVQILDLVFVDKFIDVDAFVDGTSALATAKGEAFAIGTDSHTETLGVTQTTAVADIGSSSSSIAQSLSVAEFELF
jgi:hypothetical protein